MRDTRVVPTLLEDFEREAGLRIHLAPLLYAWYFRVRLAGHAHRGSQDVIDGLEERLFSKILFLSLGT